MNSLYDEFRVALHSVWTRRWLVLAVAWGICILGWLAIASIPNRYDSRARLLVDVNQILPDDTPGGLGAQQQVDQIRATLTSARNMEKVAVSTGLIPTAAGEREKAGAVAMLQQNIKVVPQQDNIFEITSSIGVGSLSDADNAKLASGVLDSLITVFRDDQLRGGRMDAREGLKFLDAQIADREKALREVEARRATFEASNIGLVGGGAGSPAQRVDAMRAEINQIDSQLVAAQAALAAANGQLAQTPATINVPGAPTTGAGVARQQLAGAQNELAQMRAKGLTDAHPDVIAVKSQIAALKAQAEREGDSGGGNAQNPAYASLAAMRAERQATVSALSARKAQLTGDIAKITSQQIQNPGVAAEYDRINGEYTALKAQYDKLLAQREQVRLRGQVQTETDAIKVELLDPPSKPTTPSAPNRPLFLTAVLLAGIAGGIGAAFGLAQIRTSYPTAARLERASGLPVIGSITEVVTPERQVERKKRLVWLASGAGALVALYALLLVAEFVQRGLVA